MRGDCNRASPALAKKMARRARALLASGRAALQQLSTGSLYTSTERLPAAVAATTSLDDVPRGGSLPPWHSHCRGLSAQPQLAESAEAQLPSYGAGTPAQPWPREEAARRPLPSVDEVAERLRSHKGASCSSGGATGGGSSSSSSSRGGAGAASLHPEILPWREVVAALQASQQGPVTGAQMLTDTFG